MASNSEGVATELLGLERSEASLKATVAAAAASAALASAWSSCVRRMDVLRHVHPHAQHQQCIRGGRMCGGMGMENGARWSSVRSRVGLR